MDDAMCKTEQRGTERIDPLSPAERSKRMSKIRGKDTKIEIAVRRLVHGLGFRYRLHGIHLTGHPDMVFPGRRKVIFVHGCFWHLHGNCRQYRLPRSRRDFWIPKLNETRRRDEENQTRLREAGWDVLVVWECQIKDREALADQIRSFLEILG